MQFHTPEDIGPKGTPAEELMLRFTEHLTRQEFREALALTSVTYRLSHSAEELADEFGSIVGEDFGPIGRLEVGSSLLEWPDKRPDDIGFVYVSIPGPDYAEGLSGIVMREGLHLKVRDIEWGRP